ncbi:sigma-70 family RNA polymerase sigma factor [Vibrio crassostreae]|uniref:RNA polymerase sigma factor n=1 Tax=Vibrio crassostreae TaxID=246167 RepID=UPI002E17AF3F|nr:sigma-70 family RNA polymerase sigma factor [Vibrio crassostreae]
MFIYSNNSTDKELFSGSVKGNSSAFTILGKRYESKLKAIFYKSFKSIEKSLSFSVEHLFVDFKSMVLADLLMKPLGSLTFDEDGSIGGLIDTIAKDRAYSMYTRTENHRSKDSTETRKKKALEEKLKKEVDSSSGIESSKRKFDFGFSEFDENEIEAMYVSDPERKYIAEDLKLKFLSNLSPEQQIIVELRAKGVTQTQIALETGLTLDKVRAQLKKIGIVATEVQS